MTVSGCPWTEACQTPLSMRFPRQEYWSGLPFSSPGDLLNPGIEPGSPTLQADSLLSEPPGMLYITVFLRTKTLIKQIGRRSDCAFWLATQLFFPNNVFRLIFYFNAQSLYLIFMGASWCDRTGMGHDSLKKQTGISLVVQWLRTCLPMQV